MFVIVGIKAKTIESEENVPDININFFVYRRKNVHQYQRIWNIGGILPQKTRISFNPDDENDGIDQYYFTDSRNNI